LAVLGFVGTGKRLIVRQAQTDSSDEAEAVRELSEQLDCRDAKAVLVFCSPKYDLDRLGRCLAASFAGPVAGCTTSGQIGPSGYQKGGITAVSLSSEELRVRPFLIAPLEQCQARAAEAAFAASASLLEQNSRKAFGLVLCDGLSVAEERLAASLYQSLADIPLIGGSAGDELAFQRTHVYHEGKFVSDAASLVIFETTLPFATFKVQHLAPTRQRLVVTMADPAQRVVHEINGEPAAEAYAEMLGLDLDELNSGLFAKNPVMLRNGEDYYVRSIKRVNSDHSLSFFCAVEQGLVLTIGKNTDPIAALERGLTSISERVAQPEVILGFDCVLRRLELEKDGTDAAVGAWLASNRVVGFSTYGEQYNAIYVNQTMTAVALGGQ
jgi:hypothetical protein